MFHKLKNIALFLLIMSANILFAQKQGQERIDSLKIELSKSPSDTTRVLLHCSIAWDYTDIDLEKAETHIREALELSQKINFLKGEGRAYGTLGTIENMRGNYVEAIKNHTKSLNIDIERKEKVNQAIAYYNMGLVFKNMGNMVESLNSFQNAYKIFEEKEHHVGMANALQGMGGIHYGLREFDKALPYYQKALKINQSIHNLAGEMNNMINIGGIHNENKDFETALSYYDQAGEIAEELGDNYNLSLIYNNIGLVYELNNDLDQALNYNLKSKELAEKVQAIPRLREALYRIGSIYHKKQEPKEARKWFVKTLEISKQTGNIADLIEDYGALIIIDSLLGDFKSSHNSYYWYTNYKDSLYSDETTRKLTEARMEYEFENTQDSIRLVNEMEIAIRDASIASVRRQRWFFIGGLFALGLIGGLLYYQSRQRQRHNEKLRTLNAELDQANRIKTRFFSILNHDLRGPVSNLIHFLHLKKENPELLDEETKDRLEQKTTKGAENLLVTMEDLLLWSKGQMENFEPQPKKITVAQLFADTKKVFSGYQNIQFEYYDPDAVELFTDEDYLKTIIRNLTSNAINVFTTTQNPLIIWKASLQNGKAMLSITDNGPGADSERFRALYDDKEVVGIKSGLGLHLIRDLAKAIDCMIEVDTAKGKGTSITLRFS